MDVLLPDTVLEAETHFFFPLFCRHFLHSGSVVVFLFCYNCFQHIHDVSDVQRSTSDKNHRGVGKGGIGNFEWAHLCFFSCLMLRSKPSRSDKNLGPLQGQLTRM